jgi:hypothetical protein
MLGEDFSATRKEFGRRAERAVNAFLTLYGTGKGVAA